jgi:hypothetical protein
MRILSLHNVGVALVYAGILGLAFMAFIYVYGYLAGIPLEHQPHSAAIVAAAALAMGGLILGMAPEQRN